MSQRAAFCGCQFPRGRFDIYHPTLYRVPPWVRRRRIVVTHHDCTHERFPQLFRNAAFIIATKRKLFAQADAIVCVSSSSQRDLLHIYGVAEQKNHVVPHGFTPLRIPSEDTQTFGSVETDPYLLYVGSRAGYKNFSLLVEAFSLSGAWPVPIACWPLGVACSQQKSSNKLLRGGSRTGYPSFPERPILSWPTPIGEPRFLYTQACTRRFGFPPLEAMSLGCPVLVNQSSSLPKFAETPHFTSRVANPRNLPGFSSRGSRTRRALPKSGVWAKNG